MGAYWQLIGKLFSFSLLGYFVWRTFLKSDKPAAVVLMLGLMIIAEDYAEKAFYIPGLDKGSLRFSEILILYLLIKDRKKGGVYVKGSSRAIDVLWVPYIALFLTSVFSSSYLFIAVRNFRFCVFDPFLIYLIGCRGFDEESDYKRFSVYLGILVLVVAAGSIDDLKYKRLWFGSELRNSYEYWGKETIGRFGSFFMNPNFFASFLVLSLPILFSATMSGSGRGRKILVLSLVGGILGLILTYTRAAYVAVAASIFFSVFYGLFRLVKVKKVLVLLCIVVGSVAIVFPGAFNKIVLRANTMDDDSEIRQSRVEIWLNALELLKRHPVVGIGLSEADYVLEAAKFSGAESAPRERGKFGRGVSGFMDQPHNSYISLALWVSPFSLLVFLLMNYKVLRLGQKLLRIEEIPLSCRFFCLGAAIGIFGYLVVIFFDTQLLLRTNNSLFWLVFGLIISVYRKAESRKILLSS